MTVSPGGDELPAAGQASPWSNALSVSALNQLGRELIEDHLQAVWVTGELSGVSYAQSGHIYFSLKDSAAQVRCTLWRSQARQLTAPLKDGQLVVVLATATLYTVRGDFQLNVMELQSAGQGQLYRQFLALKEKLLAEGLFTAKRPLPKYPRRVLVITSRQAAALQDVCQVMARRSPQVQLMLLHASVQGAGAVSEICRALASPLIERVADVVLLCRGGGSLEDLWCFNSAEIAYAIRACSRPVVTGIGHETDVTIADFAADLRAATPSAAAEVITPARAELMQHLRVVDRSLTQAMRRYLDNAAQTLDALALRLVSPVVRLRRDRQRLLLLQQRQGRARDTWLQRERLRLDSLTRQLTALNPEAVLSRGYAIVRDEAEQIVIDATNLVADTPLRVQFAKGQVRVRVLGSEPGE